MQHQLESLAISYLHAATNGWGYSCTISAYGMDYSYKVQLMVGLGDNTD